MDEMSLYFQATTTRQWAPIGQTPLVRVSGQREHVHFYGALNLRSGHQFTLPALQMNSQQTVDFLQDLLIAYPSQPILLLWDRAPWHKGHAVQTLLAAHPRLQMLYFPPACPELNPQEHVWSLARAAVSHNHGFPDFSALRHAFLHFLSDTLFHFDWLETYAPSILFES